MSRLEPEEGLFHDASAYFSDEEWKLLHDWQKELYRNVMKEIHQALISLGPLIATTVCSLRAKEKEDLHPLDDRDSKKKHRIQYALGDTMGDTDVHFRINNEESVQLNNPPRLEGRQQNEYLGTGFPFLNSDVCLSKEEPVAVSIDHIGSEMAENSRDTNSGFEVLSLRIKDEEDTYCMEHLERRRLKRVQNPAGDKSINRQKEARDSIKQTHPYKISSEKINTMILQSSDKEANAGSQIWAESDRHLRGEKTVQHEISFSNSLHLSMHPRSPNRGRPDTYNECNESKNRKKTVGDSIKYTEITPPCKAFSEKINTLILPGAIKEASSASQIWQECYQELRGEKTVQCEGSFSSSVDSSLQQGVSNFDGSDKYSEWESDLMNLQFPKDLPVTQQDQRTYACAEGDKSCGWKGEAAGNMRTNSRERPYACTECEKSFYQKTHLITHHRIHSGEKPYTCTFCHKRFNRKDYLDEHVRIHTGERPYKCPKCEKSFFRKSHLNYHQRKHIQNIKNSN
ncbi:hypothetical protein NDU88_000074 [Pleurodeles waltl]|uniref:Uncharacterized protein n=1 Tax=Pleurodeles waltl TaxID=8319 RepID=A0AAV7L7G2_PLEWA|nr:hypothetical protein NDU88_000074 [Pleurodeles waltl]